MYPRILVVLLAVVLICTSAACSGGSGQGDQSQGSGSDQADGGGEDNKEKIKGNVARTVPDRDIFVVRAPGEEPVVIRYRTETVEVKLDGEQADPGAIKAGQSASVEYLTRTTPKDKKVNVARSVELQTADDGGSGEETTS